MNSHVLQNVTTVAVAALAWALAYIALSARRYERVGREALLCASAFIFSQAAIRTLSINDVITPDSARALVGVSAFCAVAVLGQLAWLKRLDNHLRKEEVQC